MSGLLGTWLDDEVQRRQLTLEGLADVDAGRVVDHADVLAWAASLDVATAPDEASLEPHHAPRADA